MKSFVYAFLTCLIACIALYATLYLVGVKAGVAKTVSFAVFALLPKIREEILRATQKKGDIVELKSLRQYEVSAAAAIVYPAIVSFVLSNTITAIFSAAATLGSIEASKHAAIVVPVCLIFGTMINFMCGVWIGQRKGTKTYLCSIASSIITTTLPLAATLLISNDYYKNFYHHEKSVWYIAHQYFFWTTLILPAFLIGTYVGTRRRLAAYLTYLSKHLDDASKSGLIDLAFEEALRLSITSKKAASSDREKQIKL